MGMVGSYDSPVLAVSVFAITVLIFYYLVLERKRKGLPPGPRPLPLIGSLHLLGREPARAVSSLARKYGPVMSLRLGAVDAVFVSSTEAAKLFLKANDAQFSTRPLLKVAPYLSYDGDMTFAPYGDNWRKMRKASITHLLGPKSVESLSEPRKRHVAAMMRNIWRESQQGTIQVDITKIIHNTMYEILWSSMSRKPVSKELSEHSYELMKVLLGGLLYDVLPWAEHLEPCLGFIGRAKSSKENFDNFAESILQEHSDGAPDECKSFVDNLMGISKEDPSFTRDNVKAVMNSMFVGGTTTTAMAVEWTLSHLLRNPECLRRAQKEVDELVGNQTKTLTDSHVSEMKYLRWVLKETFRLNLTALIPPRQAVKDVRIDNYRIPKGTWVVVNAWAMARDEKLWEDPDEFKPERFADEEEGVDMTGQSDFKSLPFGAGRRMCPGYNLAVQVTLVIVGTLLHAFDLCVEGDPTELDMTVNFTAGSTRMSHLHVLPKLRNKHRQSYGLLS